MSLKDIVGKTTRGPANEPIIGTQQEIHKIMSRPDETRIINSPAATMYVSVPEHSYGIFCWSSEGSLFLDSDWGMFGYSWRSAAFGGGDFRKFLEGTNAEYILGKFELNWNVTHSHKQDRLSDSKKIHLTALIHRFLYELKHPPFLRSKSEPVVDSDVITLPSGKTVSLMPATIEEANKMLELDDADTRSWCAQLFDDGTADWSIEECRKMIKYHRDINIISGGPIGKPVGMKFKQE